MIKDKITLELKNRFIEDIRKTIETGKERGFLICSDKDNKLSPTESCEGEECTISMKQLKKQCHFKVQGDFHTHPHGKEVEKYLEEKLGRKVPFEEAKRTIIDTAKSRNRSLTAPSYGDVLGAIIARYSGNTLGTTCIGVDVHPNEVECWSTKNDIKDIDLDFAFRELNTANVSDPVFSHDWVKPLFHKEVIELNR